MKQMVMKCGILMSDVWSINSEKIEAWKKTVEEQGEEEMGAWMENIAVPFSAFTVGANFDKTAVNFIGFYWYGGKVEVSGQIVDLRFTQSIPN